MRRVLNLAYPSVGKRGARKCYILPGGSSLFGGIGPHFRAILSLVASYAVNRGVYHSQRAAMRSFIAEITRLQVQSAMLGISDYQLKLKARLPPTPRVTINGSETE